MDWVEFSEVLLKGLVGGVLSLIGRKVIENSQKELEKLQGLPPEFTDRDKEELLTHYLEQVTEEIGDSNKLTVSESVKTIRSRAGVFATYFYLKVQRLPSEGNNIGSSEPSKGKRK